MLVGRRVKKMDVVPHEHVGVYGTPGMVARLPEHNHEVPIVITVQEHGRAVVAAMDHVHWIAGENESWHGVSDPD